jgi:quercetin dioxygenase-like cupin family protein
MYKGKMLQVSVQKLYTNRAFKRMKTCFKPGGELQFHSHCDQALLFTNELMPKLFNMIVQ